MNSRKCHHIEMRKLGDGTGAVQLMSKTAKIQDNPFHGKYGFQVQMGIKKTEPLVMPTGGLQKRESWRHFCVLLPCPEA